MTDTIHILLVEDDVADATFTSRMLKQGFGDACTLHWVQDVDSGRLAIKEAEYSLYLIDYALGASDGLGLVREMVAQGCTAPILLLTGMESTAIDLEAMHAGATDYLVKDEMTAALLTKAIRYALGRHQFNRSLIEAQELLKQKNRKLSQLYNTARQFVDNVSHEFRTPLAVIKEYAAILKEGLAGPVNEEQSRYLSIVLNRIDDLGLMVNDMLDASRLEAGLLRTRRTAHTIFDIVDRIDPLLRRKADTSNVTFCHDIPARLPDIFCDGEKMGRAIINLAVNAIKFCGEAGQVTLWARANPDRQEITIGVTDNGPGIAREQMQVIFERFRQLSRDDHANSQGFGLGLNIANELVKLNFGQMALESEVGHGSTFSFGVPLFSPLHLIDKWLCHIESMANPLSHVFILSISCNRDCVSETYNQHNDVLIDAIFSDDLLLQRSPGCWILLAVCAARPQDIVMRRIEQTLDQFNLHRPGDELPGFTCNAIGTWNCHTDKHAIRDAAKAQFAGTLEFERVKSDAHSGFRGIDTGAVS